VGENRTESLRFRDAQSKPVPENQVPLSRLCLFRAGFHLTRLSGITFFGSHFDLLKRSAPSSAGALHLFATAW
jgi:hypothetical protein